MFKQIPDEMKNFKSWICWKFEDHGEVKLRKVPYQFNGRPAKSTDPQTWGNFEGALSALATGKFDGIGFVLSEADPYSIIDLDDTDGNFEELKQQKEIFARFDSYSELSPSKTGIHIIVRGKLPTGRRRRANIEVYTTGRFMTMTGNVYHASPIHNRQELLNILIEFLGRGAPVENFGTDQPQQYDDDTIYHRALSAHNGAKFYSLWCGEWQGVYPSQSEADQALINIIVFYTQNYEQIIRMFQYSALGKRDKAKRKTYLLGTKHVNGMIQKGFDKMVPPIDIMALQQAIEISLSQPKDEFVKQVYIHPASLAAPMPTVTTPYSVPPGLVGEIANFIYNQAARPVPEIALAGALGLMAGICGRAYNVSGTGLNQYMLLIARTGAGKEAIASGIDAIIGAVKKTVPCAGDFIGPSEIASPQALNKYLSGKSACFVSLVGEFGLFLSQMCDIHAPAHMVGLKRMLLDLFNKSGSGRQLGAGVWSDMQKNTQIVNAPAVTLLGESTPDRFYTVLNEMMISEGLLPRFTVIEYKGPRVELNEHAKNVKPDARLIEHCASLCNQAFILNQQNVAQEVNCADDAAHLFKEFNVGCDAEMNNAGAKAIVLELWNRAHVKALKLAALVAVGVNPYAPIITLDVARWSINLIVCDVHNILERFEKGEIGEDASEDKQSEILRKLFVDYVKMPFDKLPKSTQGFTTQQLHDARIMPFRLVSYRTLQLAVFKNDRLGHYGSVQKTLKALIDSGDIIEITSPTEKAKFGAITARLFVLANTRLLH